MQFRISKIEYVARTHLLHVNTCFN